MKICIDIMYVLVHVECHLQKDGTYLLGAPCFGRFVRDICRLPGSGLARFCKLLVDIGDVFAMTCLGSAQIILLFLEWLVATQHGMPRNCLRMMIVIPFK